MKVVFVADTMKAGGLQRVISIITNQLLINYGIEINILLFSRQPIMYDINSNIRIIQPKKIKFSNIKIINALLILFYFRRNLKRIKPDHIIGFHERYNALIILASLFLKSKVHVSNRASPLSSLKGYRGLVNPIMYRLTDTVILQTNKSKELLSASYRGCNLVIIYNPIETVNTAMELERNKIITNVGSIGGLKNQSLLVDYFNAIDNEVKRDWQLHFIGDGPKRDELQKKINWLNLNSTVSILGYRKDIKELNLKASIFAFTSTSEGFPNALAEAMAAGCACISYDCVTGPADLIDDGVNGFLIPLDNEKLYIEKLRLLIVDADLRKQFGIAAREKMKQFSTDKIAQQYLDFILT